MGYFSALDLDIQIHVAEAGHASGQAHDAFLCGQCRPPRPTLTVAPREWRDVLAPMTEAMRPRSGAVRYLGRAPRRQP